MIGGITLGNGVQVGAGAVVTKSFPDNAIIAGVPARLLRFRSAPQEAGNGATDQSDSSEDDPHAGRLSATG